MKASERQSFVEELKEFLHAESSRPVEQTLCPHCGKIMKYIELKCWLYDTDARGSLRVPVCGCEFKEMIDGSGGATVAASSNSGAWQEPYITVLETDTSKLLERISAAELALVSLGRELFHALGDPIEERRAVTEAVEVRHALRNLCLATKGYGGPGLSSARIA